MEVGFVRSPIITVDSTLFLFTSILNSLSVFVRPPTHLTGCLPSPLSPFFCHDCRYCCRSINLFVLLLSIALLFSFVSVLCWMSMWILYLLLHFHCPPLLLILFDSLFLLKCTPSYLWPFKCFSDFSTLLNTLRRGDYCFSCIFLPTSSLQESACWRYSANSGPSIKLWKLTTSRFYCRDSLRCHASNCGKSVCDTTILLTVVTYQSP